MPALLVLPWDKMYSYVIITCLLLYGSYAQDYTVDIKAWGGEKTIKSIGYPVERYPLGSAQVTYYRTQLGQRGGFIEGKFNDCDLAPGQKIEIFFGSSPRGNPYITHTGGSPGRPNFVSDSYAVVIKFTNPAKINDGTRYVGWSLLCEYHLDYRNAIIQLSPSTNCGHLNPSSRFFTFRMPYYEEGQPMEYDCVWAIKPLGGREYAFVNITSDMQSIWDRSEGFLGRVLEVRTDPSSIGGGKISYYKSKIALTSEEGFYLRLRNVKVNDVTGSLQIAYMSYDKAPGSQCPAVKSSWHYDFCCSDLKMIPWSLRCDGHDHCRNGDDEDPVICRLKPTYGGTGNGHSCVTSCQTDGTRERWCYTSYGTPRQWGYCMTSLHDKTKVPVRTTTTTTTEPPATVRRAGEECGGTGDHLRCPDGSCLMRRNVPRSCRRTCISYAHWTCSDGYCIKKEDKCDGVRNCFDGSDETVGCRFSCGSHQWKCATGDTCLDKKKYCDGTVDCSDGSDEQGCPSSPSADDSWDNLGVILGAVAGSVVLVILLVFIGVCYQRRRDRRRRRPATTAGSSRPPVGRPHVVYHPTTVETEQVTFGYGPVAEPSAPPDENTAYAWQGRGDGSVALSPPSSVPSAPPPDGSGDNGGGVAPPPSYNDVMAGAYNVHQP